MQAKKVKVDVINMRKKLPKMDSSVSFERSIATCDLFYKR